jgi:hypothetical protein
MMTPSVPEDFATLGELVENEIDRLGSHVGREARRGDAPFTKREVVGYDVDACLRELGESASVIAGSRREHAILDEKQRDGTIGLRKLSRELVEPPRVQVIEGVLGRNQ